MSKRKTGFVFDELYMWHDSSGGAFPTQPSAGFENPETKRRFYNLLAATRLLDNLQSLRPRPASEEDLARLTKEYDQVYSDDHAVREKFFSSVDPILQVSQRAKLRWYIFQKEQQVSKFIQLSQNPAGNPAPTPAPANPAPPQKP